MGGFKDYLGMILGWWSSAGSTPAPTPEITFAVPAVTRTFAVPAVTRTFAVPDPE